MIKKSLYIIFAIIFVLGCRPALPTDDEPVIDSVSSLSTSVEAGGTITITVDAYDPEGVNLTYTWSAATGTFSSTSSEQTIWTAPTTAGTYIITISVSDGFNPAVEDTITITVTEPANPEINVTQNSTNYLHSSTFNFANTELFDSTAVIFTIENSGTDALSLTGTPIVNITGANSGMFVVTQPSSNSVAASSSILFTVSFEPTGTSGDKTATLEISSNDSDESTYQIILQGTATTPTTSPEINVQVDSADVASSEDVPFGTVLSGSSSTVTFTIQNTSTGTASLILSGTPNIEIGGTDSSMFEVTIDPTLTTIPVSSSTTFQVTFTPTGSAGAKSATLTINNNDIDEYAYVINLTGSLTTTPEPEINIKQNTTSYISGTDTYDFSNVVIGQTETATFTIENTGSADLSLSGTPIVDVTAGSDFTVSTQPSTATVASSESTTFVVTFAPSGATGEKTATLTIANNDGNENPYTIDLTGTATVEASEVLLELANSNIENNTSMNITVSAVDANGQIDTSFTGDITLSASNVVFTPSTISITTGGTATTSVNINNSGLSGDYIEPIVTASATGLTSDTDNLTIYSGTPVTDANFTASGGFTTDVGLYVLPGREASATTLTMQGDITIGAGTSLLILEGTTINMAGNTINVEGKLSIQGTDEKRVMLKSTGSDWGGIIVDGDAAGSSELNINGTFIKDLSNRAISIGTGSSSVGGNVTVTNSRIEATGTAIQMDYAKDEGTYNFSNNIFEFATATYALYLVRSLGSDITINFRYNTVIGLSYGTSTSAIRNSDSTLSNVHNFEYNLIANGGSSGFNWAYTQNGENATRNFNNNFCIVSSNYDGTSGGSNFTTSDYNVYESSQADNFSGTWSTTTVFENFSGGDYRFARDYTAPSLTQVSNITSMEGCLSNSHANQIGAYGNNGYPPLPTEN